MRLTTSGAFLLLLLCLLEVSAADADTTDQTWTLVEASGAVHINRPAGDDLNARIGARLLAPFNIRTGPGGHAVVAHGQDRLTVGPNSRMTVARPARAAAGIITHIKQMLGSVLYRVQHRVKGDFQVDTPYLVSVVKGTTFNIHVTPDANTVALVEGRLLVYTPDRSSQRILKPGQVAIKTRQGRGIMLKDQQSLSKPVRGPITVVKEDGTQETVASPAAGPRSGVPMASVAAVKQSADVGIGAGIPGGGTRTEGDVHNMAGRSLSGIGGGIAAGVGTAAIGGAVNVGAGVPGVSAGAGIGGGAVNVGAGVPGVSAGAGIGGGAVNVGAGVPGVSAGASVGGGAVNVGASLPGVSTTSGIGNTLNNITPTTQSPRLKLGP